MTRGFLASLLLGLAGCGDGTQPTQQTQAPAGPRAVQTAQPTEGRWCGVLCEPGSSIECRTATGAVDLAWCTDGGLGWYTCGTGRQGGVAVAGETCGEGYACKRGNNGSERRCWSICEANKDIECEGGAVGLVCQNEAAKRAAEACTPAPGGYCCPDDSLAH
jgi:hypothetical protein